MILSFGFWDIIKVPFGYVLEWLYQFSSNYGLALILFSLIVKLILLPMSIKSKKSMMKMSRLAPQVKRLEAKFGDDKEGYQKATMALYKEEGVSMYSGCLWSFIPLIIIIPLYQVIRQPMEYLMHLSSEQAASIVKLIADAGVNLGKQEYYQQLVAASHISEYLDQIRTALPELANTVIHPINFQFLGVDLSAVPNWKIWQYSDYSWANIGLFLIPIVAAASQLLASVVSQKMNNSVVTDEKGEKDKDAAAVANQSTKMMLYMMPLMSLWFCFFMPAAISIYWIAQAVLGMIQDALLTLRFRKVYDAEDAERQERALQRAIEEAEKERVRAQRRAENPDGITENTSKKKLQQKQKEEAEAAARQYAAKKRAELGLSVEEDDEDKPLSGIPDRPFCKGRAYKPERYGRNTAESADE